MADDNGGGNGGNERIYVSTHAEGIRRCRRDEPIDTGYVPERYMSDSELMRRASPGNSGDEWVGYKARAAARNELDRRWGGPEWSESTVERRTWWEIGAVIAGVVLGAVLAWQWWLG